MTLFEQALVWHLVADWLLQNEWMQNKTNLLHPAAWVHSGIHLLGLLVLFPTWLALLVGLSHLLIDTRKPLIWWRTFFRQTQDPSNPASMHVAFWGDQVAHIAIIAIAVGVL